MRGVDEAVNSLFGLHSGPAGFQHLVKTWRDHQHRAKKMVWEHGEKGPFGLLDGGSVHIEPNKDGVHVLRFDWPGGGSSALGAGDVEALIYRFYGLILTGGPFGGPCVDDLNTGPRRFTWVNSPLPDQARVRYYGCGYGFRHRPLGDERYLVTVAPEGSFIPCGAGQPDDMGTLSEEVCTRIDPFAPEIGDGCFFVRWRGDPIRLRYAAIPGLLGYGYIPMPEDLHEIFLCLFGRKDLALVTIMDGNIRLVARDRKTRLVGAEIGPPALRVVSPPSPPSTLAPEAVAAAIGRLRALSWNTREHFVELALAARGAIGMRSVRLLLWQVALAHELGLHAELTGPLSVAFQQIAATTGIRPEELPHERARYSALRWLAQRSPFFYPMGAYRERWGIRCDWLARPPLSCADKLARLGAMES